MKNKICKTSYAYLAGYIDGDGCFFLGKYRPKNRISYKFPLAIIISSTNVIILNKFKSLHGGSVASAKKIIAGHKQLHYLTFKKGVSLQIIDKILPYLVEKKEEAEIVKLFAKTKTAFNKIQLISKLRVHKDINNLVSKFHKIEFESFKNTVIPTKEDFAYLAGFIDAECCLCISKYKPKNGPNFTYKITLRLNNSKAPIFKWLLERFGGHTSFINRVKTNRKNQLDWQLSAKALSKLLPKIVGFLEYKKPVCIELIKFYNTTLTNGGARHTEKFRESYASIIRAREEIVEKVHKLNLKGNKNT